MPVIKLYNHQRQHKPSLPWLRRVIKAALPLCEAEAKSSEAPLLNLDEIEFTIISDTEISRVHAEFLEDPNPTDVITFQHGEVLVSADTAVRQGAEHDQTLDQELALYLIHGLMHLGGWEDDEESEAKEMTQRQESILKSVTAQLL
jgi:probable rRNA maturation factor